jgi:hypothetical protein
VYKLSIDQIKELLRMYPQMSAQIKNFETALRARNPDAEIYSASVSQVISDKPHSGQISDKTQRIAIEYERNIQKEDMDIRGLISTYRNVSSQILTALESLTAEDADAINFLYLQNIQPADAYEMLNKKYSIYSERSRRNRIKLSLQKISSMLCITKQEFEDIKKEGRP